MLNTSLQRFMRILKQYQRCEINFMDELILSPRLGGSYITDWYNHGLLVTVFIGVYSHFMNLF